MMMRFLGMLNVIVLLVLIVACATKSPQYIQATTIEPIRLPGNPSTENPSTENPSTENPSTENPSTENQGTENQSIGRLGELYPVPLLSVRAAKKFEVPLTFEVPLPPAIGVQGEGASIASLQSMGERFWVVNAKSAAVTWSQLMAFLQQRGIALVKKDLATAMVETDWFEQSLQPGFMVRYRLRLEHGLQPNTTEIYLFNHKSTRGVFTTDGLTKTVTAWRDEKHDPIHAKWFADELVNTFNDPKMRFSNSYLAATINLPEKITVSEFNGEAVLLSTTSDERLHKALGKTLSGNGFLVYDKALDKGVFHFDQYTARRKRSMLFGLITTASDNTLTAKSRHALRDILKHLPNEPEVNTLFFPDVDERLGGKRLSGVPGYLLVIQQQQGHTLVKVRDGYGRLLKSNKARDILDSIRLHLI